MAAATGTSADQSTSHSRAYVESILSQLDRLPTLSSVAMRLIRATTADDTSARDLVDIVRGDASLTSAILRALHRADLGVSRDVTGMERAVTLLGFTAVRNVVLTVSVFEALSGTDHSHEAVARRNALWLHNVAVACAAEALAGSSSLELAPGDAFVCGLLHDVGKIALEACFPKSYTRAIERVERHHRCICDAEHDVFGLDHTVAGKRLLTHWGVGQAAVECCWLHHEPVDALPSSVAHPKLVGLVHLADGLVRQHGIGFSGYAGQVNLGRAALDVGVPEEALTEVVRRLPEQMEPLTAVMGLDGTAQVLSTDALLRANRQLGGMNAELTDANRALNLRTSLLDQLVRFTTEAGAAENLSALCASAAQASLQALGAEAVFVSALDVGGTMAHIGSASADRAEPVHRHVEQADLCKLLQSATQELASDPPVAHPLPDRWHAVLRAVDPEWTGAIEACRLLPLIAGGDITGVAAIRFAATANAANHRRSYEFGLLSCMIGQALHSMKARESAERMSEQLVELNRRYRDAQAEMLRGKSVSMIAKMADGAAHELNNPLSVISGRAQLALKDCRDPELRKALQIIIEQTTRAAGIATELMEFAKPELPSAHQQPLSSVLEPLCQHWREGLKLRAEQLRLHLTDAAATVYADPKQLRAALDAIVRNAAQAAVRPDHFIEINSPSRSSDETVRLVIRDNGSGMSSDVLEHAVDPFFSHRPAGRGRGLGLSRANRLIELNGGRLWIESIPNLGTTVTIEVPARAADA